MRLREIMSKPIFEMAYRRKVAERIICGLERPVNEHLLKIMCIIGPSAHWRSELRIWLVDVAAIRLKKDKGPDRPPKWQFIYELLYDGRFGDHEIENIGNAVEALSIRGHELDPELDLSLIVTQMRSFHLEFAKRCERGGVSKAEILAIVETIPPPPSP